jgi:vesicle coat complex subunit
LHLQNAFLLIIFSLFRNQPMNFYCSWGWLKTRNWYHLRNENVQSYWQHISTFHNNVGNFNDKYFPNL